MRLTFLTYLIVSVCLLNGRSVEAAEPPAALMVYPGASDSLYVASRSTLSYHVDAKFPATVVIQWVSGNLQKAGWKPLEHDFLNPDSPSSLSHSWQYFLDGTKDPILCVHQWLGDWKDASGNIVVYAFRYEEQPDCSTDGLIDLLVAGWYYPAGAAREAAREAKEMTDQLKAERTERLKAERKAK